MREDPPGCGPLDPRDETVHASGAPLHHVEPSAELLPIRPTGALVHFEPRQKELFRSRAERSRGGITPGRRHGRGHPRLHAPAVELRAVLGLRLAHGREGQTLEKTLLQAVAVPSSEVDRPRRVAKDLRSLEASEVVEEPAAGREHPKAVTLHLEQLEGAHGVGRPSGYRMADEASALPLTRTDESAVGVSRAPGIAEPRRTFMLEAPIQLPGEPLECFAQRRPPALLALSFGRHPAPAIGSPPLDAVDAAPGARGHELDLLARRVAEEERGRVLEHDLLPELEVGQHGGKGSLSAPVVVAVGLAIGGDGEEMRSGPTGWRSSRGHPFRPQRRIPGERAEGDVVRGGAVVQEQGDRAAAARPVQARQTVRGRCDDLARAEDRERDALGREDVQRLVVHRRLGEPHARRISSEPPLEIRDAPSHLGTLVAA